MLLLKHNVQQRGFVDEEKRAEYVVEVVETGRAVQIFADVEQFEEFRNVVVFLHGLDEAFTVDRRGDGRGD